MTEIILIDEVFANLCSHIALLDISLNHIDARIGPLTVAYEDIIVGALMLVGIGLSFMVLPARR